MNQNSKREYKIVYYNNIYLIYNTLTIKLHPIKTSKPNFIYVDRLKIFLITKKKVSKLPTPAPILIHSDIVLVLLKLSPSFPNFFNGTVINYNFN